MVVGDLLIPVPLKLQFKMRNPQKYLKKTLNLINAKGGEGAEEGVEEEQGWVEGEEVEEAVEANLCSILTWSSPMTLM